MNASTLSYLLTLPSFDYLAPTTIEEACSLLSQYRRKAKVLAGGTDLLVSMKKGEIGPQCLVSIKNISGLDYINYSQQDALRIGAMATLEAVATSPVVNDKFGLLATACKKVGTPQVRNMGTIGGNICNGGPSQDTIPSLLVLEARLKLVSPQGERMVPMDNFFICPFETALAEAELLAEIQIPVPPPRSAGCYQWLTKITADDETLVGVAVLIASDSKGGICQEARIGLCSVAPTPFRARQAEELLRGKKLGDGVVERAAQAAADETRPRSRADYRRRMTSVLVKRAINEAWQSIK